MPSVPFEEIEFARTRVSGAANDAHALRGVECDQVASAGEMVVPPMVAFGAPSMSMPTPFARGVTPSVSDPDEIALDNGVCAIGRRHRRPR